MSDDYARTIGEQINFYKEGQEVYRRQAEQYLQKLHEYETRMQEHERTIIALQLKVKRAEADKTLTKDAMNPEWPYKTMMQAVEEDAMRKEQVNTTLAERGSKYGPFIGHAQLTQDLKRVITNALSDRGKDLAEDQQEALDMICHKIGRIINGDANYDDSWRDIAGYAMLVCNRLTDKGPQ